MGANPDSTFHPPNPRTVPLSGKPADIAGALGNGAQAVAQWIDLLSTQPDRRVITLTPDAPQVEDVWTGSWRPMSIILQNPASFPIYITDNGPATLASGATPIPPGWASPPVRLPLAGFNGNFTIGVDPDDLASLTDTLLVYLYRFPTVNG